MHYRWINYPKDITPELRARYDKLANLLEGTAKEPIAIVWASSSEDWVDDNGVDPERDCLLVTQHIREDYGESGFGLNLSSHKLYAATELATN